MITRRITKVVRGIGVLHVVVLIFMLGFFAVAPPWAHADIPRYINYQGKLTDAEDNPVTGDVSIIVRIYDAESDGEALWTEEQTVTVTRGVFGMLLGSSEALDDLDFNDPYWYSVEVEDDGEMTPRQRLTTIAYAINADKLDGYDAEDFLKVIPDAEMLVTGGANENITLDPTGLGEIIMKIDSTSGDFRITDSTTNWVLVDSETGNVTIAKNLTVNGTIYGNLASTGGDSTFSSIIVTGTSDLRGGISNSSGAVTVADALTQTGAANQVTFGGNVDANSGLDVTGALTVSGSTTLSSALDMNSNIDLDYSGASAALAVTQASTGAAAQFSGGRVIVGANETTNANALSTGELYVLGDLEVDGTIYGNVSSSGTTSLGDTTLSSLVVSGTSDLQGNVDVGAGIDITGAANFGGGTTYNVDSTGQATLKALNVTETDSSTSGTVTNTIVQPTFQDGGTDSTTAAVTMDIAPTINYTGSSKTGSYTALKITATETSLPTGSNYLIDAYAGDGTSQKFYVDNSGNTMLAGTLNMSSNKITNLAEPTVSTDAVTKNYADAITPATAGGWTDGADIVYVTTVGDNVGIGTIDPGSYKLNVAGSTNTISLYINGTEVTATAAELNIMDGVTATATEINLIDGYTGTTANLNTLTDGSNADLLHAHTVSSLTGNVVSSVDGVSNDGGDIDLVAGSNITITPDDGANTITIASTSSGDETGTTSLTFKLDSDNSGTAVANGAGIVMEGGTGTDLSLLYNSTTGDLDVAGITGGLDIPSGALYKINGSQIAAANLSDGANIAHINAIETISADWVNTANPWSDDEVADNITASNYLPLAGGTMTGSLSLTYDAQGEKTALTKAATTTSGQNITEYDLDISRQLTEPVTGSATWTGAVARIQNLANVAGVGALTDNASVLELNQASAGNTLILKSAGTPVVTFAKTGDITLGSGADTITSAGNLDVKLGDASGTNKLSIQTNAGAEKFAVLSDGTVKIDGGYTGTAGGGVTLQPNGDIKFDGDLYQTGSTYTVDTVRFTGNYNVGLISKFGVGVSGIDTDYLQIDEDGYLQDVDDPVTINDALTQLGGSNQVTFQGNVDAQSGLDVTGDITVTGSVDGIDLSSDSWVTSGKIVDGTIAASDIGASAVIGAKVAVGAIAKSKILELRPYASSTPDNKVNVAAGIISIANNAKVNFAGGSATLDPITSGSRIDLITINSSGTLVVIPGTQSATPLAPVYPTDKLVIAEVTINETAVQGVTVEDAGITDVRPFLNLSGGSGDSSIITTDSAIFTIGRDTDETASDVTLAFGSAGGGQKTIVYQGSSSDDFVLNDDISLGANTLKFTTNTLTDTKVGNYDAHLINTSNPHTVTAAQVGGTGIITEINAVGTTGTINTARLASEVLTQTEGDTAYVNVSGDTITGDLGVNGTFSPATISMPLESSITWATPGKILLTAEYQNASIYGDGSSNNGTMAVKNTADSNWRNYYEWVTQSPTLQDYTILVRYELPPDFSGWAASNAIKLGYVTNTADNTQNKVDFKIYKAGSGTAITTSAANVSATWAEIAIDDSALSSWSAGDILIVEIKMYSKSGNFTRAGDITLNYAR